MFAFFGIPLRVYRPCQHGLLRTLTLFLLSNHRNEINWRFRQLRLETEDLIECGWPLIETIADRLLASRYLTNGELKIIYGEQFRYSLNC